MNRKDIETFVEIQNRLHTYSKNVLSTLGKDYPECGISDIARVIGLDVIGDYLQLTYSSYPCVLPLYIPLQYVETEDVEGFCKAHAEKVRKEGKLLSQEDFIEKAYHNQWMRFYELFDVQMINSEADLDRARNKLHGLIETMTYVLQQAKQQGQTGKNADYFTEKELPQLNGAFIQFLEWKHPFQGAIHGSSETINAGGLHCHQRRTVRAFRRRRGLETRHEGNA